MFTPPFRSDIFYSVQNEDYETELAVINYLYRDHPLRVLLVASSGENALSLLTQASVGRVDAVDINAAQLQLCELRRSALTLTRDEQLQMLGATAGEPSLRRALYEKMRANLPEDSRVFWDARLDNEIAFGVQHVGRNDAVMHDLQAGLEAAGFAPLVRPLHDDELETWCAVYSDLMTPAYILDTFGLPSESLAAKIASIAGYLGKCHFRALQQPDADNNPYLTTVFLNRYSEAGYPLYLQDAGQESLRRLGTSQRLGLHTGNVLEHMIRLAASDGRFDLISLSNIADWMSEEQFAGAVEQAKNCLNPGGALLARTATERSMILDVMREHMQVDETLNATLPGIERGAWFRVIGAGFKA